MPGSRARKTVVTVIVLVIRGRRRLSNCHPYLKDKGKRIKAKA